MRVRDRLIVAVVAALVVVGAVYVVLVSPERSKVASLTSQVATAHSTLASAQASLAAARSSAAGYVDDVHAISQVMTAVPPTLNEPDLMALIAKLAGGQVDFHQINVGTTFATTGPVALGLSFTFKSTYQQLQNFLAAIDALAQTDGKNIAAHGRLFTIASLTLAPISNGRTQATVTANVYTQGANPVAATGATGATGIPQTAAATK